MNELQFSRRLLALCLAFVAGMAVFNVTVDPFAVFNAPVITGFNDVKQTDRVRLYKTFHISNHPTDGLLLGSSRIEEGMVPLPAAWPGMTPYNMAMPGATVHEMLRNLQHAQHHMPLKRLLVGLDFFMFSAFQEVPGDFSENFFAVDEHGTPKSPYRVVRNWANVLFSADALQNSITAVKRSRQHNLPPHTPQGTVNPAVHARAVSDRAAVRAMFDAFEKNYFRKGGFWLNGPNASYSTRDASGHSSLQDLEALLDYIYRHNLDARLVISPLHVRMLIGMHGIGLWPLFLDWKRELVTINERLAARYQRPPLPLWDFTLVNDHTTEWLPDDPRLPAPADSMHWFWDPAHFKPAFGDLIQQTVFLDDPSAVGMRLQQRTLDADLAAQQQALENHMATDALTRDAILQKLQTLKTYQHITATALP